MKIKILMVLVVLICTMSIGSALYTIPVKSIDTGHGYTILEDDEPYDALGFVIVDDDGERLALIDAYSGSTYNLILAHADKIYTGMVASDGNVYYTADVGGTIYLIQYFSTSPIWYNGEPRLENQTEPVNPDILYLNESGAHIRVIDSAVNSGSSIREHGGNIYYVKPSDDDHEELYKFAIGQNIPVYETDLELPFVAGSDYTPHVQKFDIGSDYIAYWAEIPVGDYSRMLFLYHHDRQTDATTEVTEELLNLQPHDTRPAAYSDIQIIGDEIIATFNLYHSSYAPGGYALSYDVSDITNITADDPVFSNPVDEHSAFRISYLTDVGMRADGDNIVIFGTEGLIADSPMETLPGSELSLTGMLTSSQDVYYNNSALDAHSYIDLTGTRNEYNGAKKIVEDRQWELLLYGPGGQIVGRYNAPYSIWDYTNVWDGINFNQHGIFSRSIEFAAPPGDWPEGTYTFRMTEFSSETGTSLIAQNTVTVANESGTVAEGGIDPDTATTEDIFSSTAFKALMFVCIPALALGLVAGLPGALVGLVLGVFLAFASGYLSLVWVILTIFAIVASFAAFARDTIIGGGRGGGV